MGKFRLILDGLKAEGNVNMQFMLKKTAPAGTPRKHERYLFSVGLVLVIGKQTNMHVVARQNV